MTKTKQIIEKVIFVSILILAALLCLLVASKKKPIKKDITRIHYDSTIQTGHTKIKDKQDTINALHVKRSNVKKKIVLHKANIDTLIYIDTTQTLNEYRNLVRDLERVNDLSDSIMILKNDQMRVQDSMIYASKIEIHRLDTIIERHVKENAALKKEVEHLQKKLNRRKVFNTILIVTILTFGYIVSK